jgi:hypothetical protein
MEYNKWLKYAEDRDMLLTSQKFDQLKLGQKYCVVEIDYILYLFQTAAMQYGIKHNTTYNPTQFFQQFKCFIISCGYSKFKKQYVTYHDRVEKEYVKCHRVKHECRFCGDISHACLFEHEYDEWLTTGSDDNFSRYMLWTDIEKMPQLYFSLTIY